MDKENRMLPHIFMALSMVLFHLFGMPLVMNNSWRDFRISRNQVYMGSLMGVFMIGIEGLMHPIPPIVWPLLAALSIGLIVAIRMQWGIDDRQYLLDMIPHHSMAILTSKEIQQNGTDPEVKALAAHIQSAQEREIKTMKGMLHRLENLKTA